MRRRRERRQWAQGNASGHEAGPFDDQPIAVLRHWRCSVLGGTTASIRSASGAWPAVGGGGVEEDGWR